MTNESAAPLVWIDLEMSGLDPESCHILEAAVVITNAELEVIAEGPNIIINQPKAVLDAMDEWCTQHHGDSGLTAAVLASEVSLTQAEDQLVEFIAQHCPEGAAPLCGNSIGQDKRFIVKYMPRLEAYLHYRVIDVSSIKELARRWYPGVEAPAKKETHRALDDILESIEELRFYRRSFFRDEAELG
jgi:oligoribonuclease